MSTPCLQTRSCPSGIRAATSTTAPPATATSTTSTNRLPVDLDEPKQLLGKFIEQKPHEWYEDTGEETDQAKGKPIETPERPGTNRASPQRNGRRLKANWNRRRRRMRRHVRSDHQPRETSHRNLKPVIATVIGPPSARHSRPLRAIGWSEFSHWEQQGLPLHHNSPRGMTYLLSRRYRRARS